MKFNSNYSKFEFSNILPFLMVILMKICRNFATNSRKWKVVWIFADFSAKFQETFSKFCATDKILKMIWNRGEPDAVQELFELTREHRCKDEWLGFFLATCPARRHGS